MGNLLGARLMISRRQFMKISPGTVANQRVARYAYPWAMLLPIGFVLSLSGPIYVAVNE